MKYYNVECRQSINLNKDESPPPPPDPGSSGRVTVFGENYHNEFNDTNFAGIKTGRERRKGREEIAKDLALLVC